MAPIALDDISPPLVAGKNGLIKEPLKISGSLDEYRSFEYTPLIGTEFPDLQLTDILDDDAKLRDLAITVSHRGVVFFRKQEMTTVQQKLLATKLGELSGKPKTSKLHKHPLLNSRLPHKLYDGTGLDDEVSIIASDANQEYYPHLYTGDVPLRPLASDQWHTDINFEVVPSDYGVLHMLDVPEQGTGGDTLFASGYEMYDRLSPPMQKLAESIKIFQNAQHILEAAEKIGGLDIDRGAPENIGRDLTAVHPVVRTNPVTGWKSLWGVGNGRGTLVGVTKHEDEMLRKYFLDLLVHNHDLQLRFRWNRKDMIIWDNRSMFHAATNDFDGFRRGNRVLSLGEAPYLDPASTSRRQALATQAQP